MRHVPPGGNWRDLPREIRDEAMGGATRGGRTGFYRRLDPDTPAPTVVASPAQRSTLLWHPYENRPISPEEAAVLQSYPTHIEKAPRCGIRALDLFAGTGWGVACQRLGIDEFGVESMPEAVAVRAANGMRTIYRDVWDGLLGDDAPRLDYELLIASPPCQTFSMAGSGAGRKALDDVLAAIDRRDYLDPQRLHDLGDELDPRTALVLTPLAHVARDTPMYVVLEQVPPVLPVWERMAEEMRRWGYSVWTGNLQAEMYGVPQTRKRAILIARADGKEAKPPTPTHSRYYPRDPKRLDEGVLPWVSMAEALGWGIEPGEVVVRTSMGEPKVDGRNGSHELDPAQRPMHTLTSKSGESRVMRSNYGTGGDAQNRVERDGDEPAPTMTSKADRNQWVEPGAVVQTNNFTAVARDADGSRSKRGSVPYRRPVDTPSPTLDGSAGGWKVGALDEIEMPESELTGRAAYGGAPRFAGAGATSQSTAGQIPREAAEPAHTVTGKGTAAWIGEADRNKWRHGKTGEPINLDPHKPGTTVAGDPRISAREHHYHGEQNSKSTRVTLEEAAALQSYPPTFTWDATFIDSRGRERPVTKTNKFLQVGNAVPPLLAEAILREVLS